MSFRVLFLHLEPIIYSQSRKVERLQNHVCKRHLSLGSPHSQVKPKTPRESHAPRLAKVDGLDERKFRKKIITRDGLSIKLLTPVILSARITKLFQQGRLQEAINMVKYSPLDAQNAAVWATLIGFVMSEKKYKEAFRLFTEMKRRGVRPSIRTFGVLLQGYNQIEDWRNHSVQLKNVHSICDQLLRFVKEEGQDEEVNIIPFNSLIKIYGKTGQYQKMYDIYNELDKKGPLAPDIYTFTILLNAIANRKKLDPEPYGYFEDTSIASFDQWSDASENPQKDETTNPNDPTAVAYKNASDARLIWKELLEVCRTPDSYAIRAIIVILAKGRPSDQNLALNICREFLGLAPPGEKAKESLIPIHAQVLNVLLSMCNNSCRHRHTLQYVEQLLGPRRVEVLATEHMNLALEARAVLASTEHTRASEALETLKWMIRMAVIPRSRVSEGGLGPQIKPSGDTYDLVALTCFYAKDWSSLLETFAIMIGCKIENFSNHSSISSIHPHSEPSGSFIACMLRTVLECGNRSDALAVIDVMQYFRMRLIQLFSLSNLTEKSPKDYIQANRLVGAIAATVPLIKGYAVQSRPELEASCSFWINQASKYRDLSRESTKTVLKRRRTRDLHTNNAP
ncbi:hypothetical protein Clacol_009906 [Clathrus columnatus]|uniref:Pentatricopeptide repeat-containing protein n=1 Tax=Clathrus columnatus TaxID=1419009 RepID=A0AAV5ASI6_9AGAM|nr:hypothetical protein Clacol_009906 [Clathrus columnatus]